MNVVISKIDVLAPPPYKLPDVSNFTQPQRQIVDLALSLALLCLFNFVSSLQGQTVTLRNVSFPGTALEVGNTVEVAIEGATPLGQVTVVQNGAPPYVFGVTDGQGRWSVTALHGPSDVGTYHQVWSVNGVPLTPLNIPDAAVPFAPRLPNFTVYANHIGTRPPPPASTAQSQCGSIISGRKWGWSPITYVSVSAVGTNPVSAAIAEWTSRQQKMTFSPDIQARLDLVVRDDYSFYGLGATYIYGAECEPQCMDRWNLCNNTCNTRNLVAYADVVINPADHANTAAILGVPTSTVTHATLVHELGHVLRLAHSPAINGKCSEVQSLMYESGTVLVACGVLSPRTSDISAINSLYPSSPAFCNTAVPNYCVVTSPKCN
jgi:hypothetical protein